MTGKKSREDGSGKVVARFISTPQTRLWTGTDRRTSAPPLIETLIRDMTPQDQEGFRKAFAKLKSHHPFGVVNVMVAEYLQKSVEELPQSSLAVPIRNCQTKLFLSDEAISALTAAGINAVGDFVTKTPEQLKETGLPPEVIRETRETLLGWGVRTIDNPPPKNHD